MSYIDDSMLEEIILLEEELKPKIKRLNELKGHCKTRGSFATDFFVCAVEDRSQTRLVSLDRAVKALGREMLESFDLIQVIMFSTVHVTRKKLELISNGVSEGF